MNLITLTLNPAFDIHCHIPNFAPYHENLAKITDRSASGKGVNISLALTACGVENLALVVLGEENGKEFLHLLEGSGLSLRTLSLSGRIRENFTLHTDNADETRISFEGFAVEAGLTHLVTELLQSELTEGSIVTLTGRNPGGLSMEETKAWLSEIKARGVRVVIDSKSFSLGDLLETKPWLIKPNEEEISAYLGREVRSFEEVAAAAKELHGQGIANVMISLGAQGAMLICKEGRFIAIPPRVEAISTIGAGDSSIAGFLAATAEGCSPEECLRRAVAYGTAACLTPGTRPPTAEGVATVLPQVQLRSF